MPGICGLACRLRWCAQRRQCSDPLARSNTPGVGNRARRPIIGRGDPPARGSSGAAATDHRCGLCTLIDGYHRFEAENGIRWTDGDAAVPAALLLGIGGPCMLTLHLGAATQYFDDGTELTSRIA